MKPTTLLVMVMNVIVAMKVFAVPLIMTGGGPADATRVLPLFIYQTAFEFFDMGRAAAMSVFLFVGVMPFSFIQVRLFTPRGRAVTKHLARSAARRRRPNLQRGSILAFSTLVMIACVTLLPYYWMVSSSLKTMDEHVQRADPVDSQSGQLACPMCVAWQAQDFTRYFLNSGVVAVAITLGNLLLSSLAGYSLTKFRYFGRGLTFLLILSTMMLPLEVTMVPLFLIIKQLNWVNSYPGPDRAVPGGWLRRLPDAPVHAGHPQAS